MVSIRISNEVVWNSGLSFSLSPSKALGLLLSRLGLEIHQATLEAA